VCHRAQARVCRVRHPRGHRPDPAAPGRVGAVVGDHRAPPAVGGGRSRMPCARRGGRARGMGRWGRGCAPRAFAGRDHERRCASRRAGAGVIARGSTGLAEAAAAIVEYADVVALTGAPASDGLALLHAVARPDVLLVADGEATPVVAFLRGVHDHRRSYDWASSIRRGPQPEVDDAQVWRLDLRSDRPFHPERFRERLGIIGSGAHRSRRCCWLPTRPGQARVW